MLGNLDQMYPGTIGISYWPQSYCFDRRYVVGESTHARRVIKWGDAALLSDMRAEPATLLINFTRTYPLSILLVSIYLN